MNALLAEKILLACRGDEVWSIETCRELGIPESWIEELRDGFESGFSSGRETLYVGSRVVNQFGGCRDVDLALKLAQYLGIDTSRFDVSINVPEWIVAQLRAELDER
jgi:hypothetical protein